MTQGGKKHGASLSSLPIVKCQKKALSTETEAFIAGAISELLAKQTELSQGYATMGVSCGGGTTQQKTSRDCSGC